MYSISSLTQRETDTPVFDLGILMEKSKKKKNEHRIVRMNKNRVNENREHEEREEQVEIIEKPIELYEVDKINEDENEEEIQVPLRLLSEYDIKNHIPSPILHYVSAKEELIENMRDYEEEELRNETFTASPFYFSIINTEEKDEEDMETYVSLSPSSIYKPTNEHVQTTSEHVESDESEGIDFTKDFLEVGMEVDDANF